MPRPYKILIADRNRHVRELLRRELLGEGYQVQAARDGFEILLAINEPEAPDLCILDLEVPYLAELAILEQLQTRQPPLPVVIYSFLPENAYNEKIPQAAAFLEKKEDTDQLKAVVAQVLGKYYREPYAQAQQ